MEDPEKHQLHHWFLPTTHPTQPLQLPISLSLHVYTAIMILNQISYLDCIAFLIFLAPQLLIRVGLIETVSCVVTALPFFCMILPIHPRVPPEIESLGLTNISSIPTPLPIHKRAFPHTPIPKIPFQPTRHSLSRFRHPLRSLCFRQHPSQDWQSVLFKGRRIALFLVPHVEAWIHEICYSVERG